MPDPVAVPQYPNVPDAPGVPPVTRGPDGPQQDDNGVFQVDVVASDSDGVMPAAMSMGQQWGIFDSSGELVLEPDSFVSMEYSKEFSISDYPVEGGGFQSYNKVERPYAIPVTMAKGGSVADRTDFIDTLASILASTDTYFVNTPEINYPNANVVHINYMRRSDKGAGMITAEIAIEEVRNTATIAFTKSQTASGTAQTDDGTVQPQTPTPTQQATALPVEGS